MKIKMQLLKKAISFTAVLALACSAAGCSTATKENDTKNDGATGSKVEKKTIALVANDSSVAAWGSVKKGAEAAAEKHGYELSFENFDTSGENAVTAQQKMIQDKLDDGTKGFIIAAAGEGLADTLAIAHDKNVPVVQVEDGIHENDIKTLDAKQKNPIKSTVATDNEKSAENAAEKLFDEVKEKIEKSDKYVVGIIQHAETVSATQRANGFSDKFLELSNADEKTKGKVTIEKIVRQNGKDNAYKTALESLYDKKANAVVITGETAVEQVYDTIAAADKKYDDIVFCGFDAGSKQLEWIKKKTGARLVGSFAADSYHIGYKAVEQLVAAIDNKDYEKKVTPGGNWWNLENFEDMLSNNMIYDD